MIKSRLCDRLAIQVSHYIGRDGAVWRQQYLRGYSQRRRPGIAFHKRPSEKETQPWIYNDFVRTGEADPEDDMATVLVKVLKRTYRLVKDTGGIFGPNVMVSKEVLPASQIMVDTAIRVREENPDMKKYFKVMYTSAGDPSGAPFSRPGSLAENTSQPGTR